MDTGKEEQMRYALFALVLIGGMQFAGTARACSCWRPTAEEHILWADAVFSGRVIVVDGTRPDFQACTQSGSDCDWSAVAQIAVDELYKGPSGAYQSVEFRWSDGASCGWSFEAGEDVMIFAQQTESGSLAVDRCSQIPYTRHRMRAEYFSYLQEILFERAQNDNSIRNNEEDGRYLFDSVESAIDYERSINNEFAMLDLYDQLLNFSTERAGFERWRLDKLWNPALDAISTSIRVGDIDFGLRFTQVIQEFGSESEVSELLTKYINFQLGNISQLVEAEEFSEEDMDILSNLISSGHYSFDESRADKLYNLVFQHAGIYKVNLSNAEIRNVAIFRSSFYDIIFDESSFDKVIINDSDFSRSNLSEVYFREMQVNNSVFEGVNLSGSVFDGANIIGSDFGGRAYLGANLSDSTFIEVGFQNVDLSHAILMGADFSEARFDDVKLDFARYNCETVWPSGFYLAQEVLIPVESQCGDRLLVANLSNMSLFAIDDLSDLDLANAKFVGTSFQAETGRSMNFTNTNLHGADFTLSGGGALFGGADLTDADFTNALMVSYIFRSTEDGVEPAILTGTRFRGTRIDLARFYDPERPERSADLSVADLRGATVQCSSADDWPFREIFLELDPGSRGALVSGNCPR